MSGTRSTPPGGSRLEDAAEIASKLSFGPLTPEEAERAVDVILDVTALAREAVAVRRVARRGFGYGWRTFDALARKAGLSV